MKLDLENKRVLVTGAGSGIGREIARQFAEEGAKVLILGRSEQPLAETASLNKNISYIVADLTSDADIDCTVDELKNRFGGLDILVNNAGWSPIYDKLGISGAEKQAHIDRVTAGVPLGRFGKVEEVAPMVLFLASEKTASYVTGCDYCVDGGYGD